MTIGAAQQFFLGASKATGGGAAGYQIERSLRFNSSDSGFCSRTPAVAGNRKTWTWAGWVKRAALGSTQMLFGTTGTTDATYSEIFFTSADKLEVALGYTSVARIRTTQVFRDPSAWQHIVVAYDNTQATASNRLRLYVNGSEVTAFDTDTRSTFSNTDLGINSTQTHYIGIGPNSGSNYLSAYLTELHLIDGQQLTPSSFTEVSATTGQLIPKTYSGSYGTNGFQLKFADNSSNTAATLGKDTSGNGNNWTPNNLSTTTGGPTSVAAASGALPVYNTTDTYGAVKGSGTRTDTNSASIVLAVPMDGTNNGTTFTDESATIRGSGSAVSITRYLAVTKTDTSKYYGSSGYFGGESGDPYAGAYLQFGTQIIPSTSADFTVEMWVYLPSPWVGTYGSLLLAQGTTNNAGRFSISINTSKQLLIQIGSSSAATTNSFSLQSWTHLSVIRSSGTIYLAINGVIENKGTISTSPQATTTYFGSAPGWVDDTDFHGYVQDLRVYSGVAKYTSNFNPPSSTANATIAAGNDSLVDTPTSYGTDTGVGGEVRGNYATLNPLYKAGAGTPTYSNGNLDFSAGGSGDSYFAGTFAISGGKYYYEATLTAFGNGFMTGICAVSDAASTANIGSYRDDGTIYNLTLTTQTSGSTYTSNDIIGVAIDGDAGTVKFYKNGAAQGSTPSFSYTAGTVVIVRGRSNNAGATASFNFGQRAFAYTAPSGFKALVDTNLPTPLTAKPNTLMDVLTWSGNNASPRTFSGLNFSPDFVWIKCRSDAAGHALYDTVRGVGNSLESNITGAEVNNSQFGYLSAFNSDGFTALTGTYPGFEFGAINMTGRTYVGWTWDAGTSTVSNTAGSITSQVRANVSAGFSIATLTTQSSGTGTFGHGLNAAPAFYIVKTRGISSNWWCYHSSLSTSQSSAIALNLTNATVGSTSLWNNTAPTSTVISLGSDWAGSLTVVAYCFAPVVGYSSMGSYVGNGSADGPFCFCGFRPRWIMLKRSDSTENWIIIDAVRDAYNLSANNLYPNLSIAEQGSASLDILSNGFKLRSTGTGGNTSGGTYIFAAFAESPFQYARAR